LLTLPVQPPASSLQPPATPHIFPAKSRIFEPAPGSKSLLVLFFRKEQHSSFSEEKEAKRLLLSRVASGDPGLGRIATPVGELASR
jgi:hypothetical protein